MVSYMAERVVGTSFGIVFQAKCMETGETVAIKKGMPPIYIKLYTYQDCELPVNKCESILHWWRLFRGLAYIHTVPGVCYRDVERQNVWWAGPFDGNHVRYSCPGLAVRGHHTAHHQAK